MTGTTKTFFAVNDAALGRRRSGGQVARVLAFYYDDLTSTPTYVYNFSLSYNSLKITFQKTIVS